MRFGSDEQRRAVFANMDRFAKRRGKSSLEMFTDDFGQLRVSSDTTPDTSFVLQTDIEPIEVKKLIDKLDEESLAGLRKMQFPKPSVMKAYDAESGYYTSEDEKVPFGRLDTPKIVIEAEKKGYGGRNREYLDSLAKKVTGASFEHMLAESKITDESGFIVSSDLPEDLLKEEFLMQIYSDYIPSNDVLARMEPLKEDLKDEVWRLRSLQRLEHPSTMEARAWRMGHQPKVGVETFVELPKGKPGRPRLYDIEPIEPVENISEPLEEIGKRKYVKSGLYTKEAIDRRRAEGGLPPLGSGGETIFEESIQEPATLEDFLDSLRKTPEKVPKAKSIADSLIDLQKKYTPIRREILEKRGDEIKKAMLEDVYEPTDPSKVKDESWIMDSDVGYKTMVDLVLSGKEVISRLDDQYLDGLLDYTTGHINPGYSVVRDRVLNEKDRRAGRTEFSKIGGYEVTKVDPCILKDYAGMNWHAAKAMGFDDYPIRKKEVLVDERLGSKMQNKTVNHEIYEDKHMGGGLSYWDAHKEALKHEV